MPAPTKVRSTSSGSTTGFGDDAGTLELSALNGTNGIKINGDSPDDEFGASVANAGDVNNDGLDDLIVGAPAADPEGVQIRAYLLLTGITTNNIAISDFSSAVRIIYDTIQLAKAVFGQLDPGTLAKSDFGSGKKKPAKDKHLIYYNKSDGTLWYDANGSKKGGKGDVAFATLDKGLKLADDDFLVA